MWEKLKKFIFDILFPQFCLGCKKEGTLICQDCLSLIEILEYQFCPFCQKPKRVIQKGKCFAHQKFYLDGLFAASSYQNPLVKKLITNFKYQPYLKTLAKPLAFLIIAHFLLSGKEKIFKPLKNSLLIPIPLSPFKERIRGFNQAKEIAYLISDFFKVNLSIDNLIKIKKTKPQIKLSKIERKKNVQGVFKLKNPKQILGKKIFLIDDVFTTGSTLEEAAKILKKEKAKQVWGIVIAREPINN